MSDVEGDDTPVAVVPAGPMDINTAIQVQKSIRSLLHEFRYFFRDNWGLTQKDVVKSLFYTVFALLSSQTHNPPLSPTVLDTDW